jgi:AcrR family transcriptional regulator
MGMAPAASIDPAVRRRRRAGEATRRRVLDAVVETVSEVGYYKASSNEIARRAGVTWGAIQHLFGSREQMMLEVVEDIQARFRNRLATATIAGSSLETRLDSVLDILAEHYEDPAFLVQIQILLDLSLNPGMSQEARSALRRTSVQDFTESIQPLLVQALGPAAAEPDLVSYTVATMVGHFEAHQIGTLAAELPRRSTTRYLLVRSVAALLREESARRGLPST